MKRRTRTGIVILALAAAGGGIFLVVRQLCAIKAEADAIAVVDYLEKIDSAMDARGVEFVLLGMPYYHHYLGEPSGGQTNEREAAQHVMDMARDRGLQAVDLLPLFRDEASRRDAWREDRFHLHPDTKRRIAARIPELLAAHGVDDPAPAEGFDVMAGDCFANAFGGSLRVEDPNCANMRLMIMQGDCGRVPNHLFLFAENYLRGARQVFWLASYSVLADGDFPPLVTEPPAPSPENPMLKVELMSAPEFKGAEGVERAAELPCRDALAEFTARVIYPKNAPASEIVLVGYVVRKHRPEGLGRVLSGMVLNVRATDYNSYIRSHPELADECVLPSDAPALAPRYWINDWNSTDWNTRH